VKGVIIAWCNTDENAFEQHVPLQFVGKRNRALGFKEPLYVLFLSGFALLSEAYKNTLQELGYKLFDVAGLYNEYACTYTQLNRFGDYEKKCFLRWLVIQNFFAGERIVHYDGDIVFNEDPGIVASKVDGVTFVLQGCPAFTVISDPLWFDTYISALNRFVHDIDAYSRIAWQERKGWEVTFQSRWSGSRFRPIISSDQDLISHLVHTGNIRQDSVEAISERLDDYIVFQNPLLFHVYNQHLPYAYSREQGIDYFTFARVDGVGLAYKKKVLLWHMQSCFNSYASKYLLRKKLLINIKPFSRVAYNIGYRDVEDYLNRYAARLTRHATRLSVYNYFFGRHDFSGLMSDRYWFKPGVFE
jgi:hypothetical protein